MGKPITPLQIDSDSPSASRVAGGKAAWKKRTSKKDEKAKERAKAKLAKKREKVKARKAKAAAKRKEKLAARRAAKKAKKAAKEAKRKAKLAAKKAKKASKAKKSRVSKSKKAKTATKKRVAKKAVKLEKKPSTSLKRMSSEEVVEKLRRKGSDVRLLESGVDKGRRDTGFKWQFVENDKTWRDYKTDASAVVEQHYDEWEAGIKDTIVRAVKSGDWHYTVDFNTMMQQNVDHHAHTKRRIRRVPDSTAPGERVER